MTTLPFQGGDKNQAEVTGRLIYGYDGVDVYPLTIVSVGDQRRLIVLPLNTALEVARGKYPDADGLNLLSQIANINVASS